MSIATPKIENRRNLHAFAEGGYFEAFMRRALSRVLVSGSMRRDSQIFWMALLCTHGWKRFSAR